MEEACHTEVVELHRFFELWMTGRLEKTEAAFARVRDTLAPDFAIVAPSGQRTDRDTLLRGLWNAHDSRDEFRIRIKEQECRELGGGLCLSTYQEWQNTGGADRARISSAIFRHDDDGPNGVCWLHLHETWLD